MKSPQNRKAKVMIPEDCELLQSDFTLLEDSSMVLTKVFRVSEVYIVRSTVSSNGYLRAKAMTEVWSTLKQEWSRVIEFFPSQNRARAAFACPGAKEASTDFLSLFEEVTEDLMTRTLQVIEA